MSFYIKKCTYEIQHGKIWNPVNFSYMWHLIDPKQSKSNEQHIVNENSDFSYPLSWDEESTAARSRLNLINFVFPWVFHNL